MFVINYAFVQGQAMSDRSLNEHTSYLQQLFDEQRLLFAGPFLDNTGGLVVLAVQNVDEAQAIVDRDPAVRNKIFQASLHPWLTLFDAHTGKSLKSGSENASTMA